MWLVEAMEQTPHLGRCCMWPIGELEYPPFRFCCEAVVQPPEGKFPPLAAVPPYCAKHLEAAYLEVGETQLDRDRRDGVVVVEGGLR